MLGLAANGRRLAARPAVRSAAKAPALRRPAPRSALLTAICSPLGGPAPDRYNKNGERRALAGSQSRGARRRGTFGHVNIFGTHRNPPAFAALARLGQERQRIGATMVGGRSRPPRARRRGVACRKRSRPRGAGRGREKPLAGSTPLLGRAPGSAVTESTPIAACTAADRGYYGVCFFLRSIMGNT